MVQLAESVMGISIALHGLSPFCTALMFQCSGNMICEAVQETLLYRADILAVMGAASSNGTETLLALEFCLF